MVSLDTLLLSRHTLECIELQQPAAAWPHPAALCRPGKFVPQLPVGEPIQSFECVTSTSGSCADG